MASLFSKPKTIEVPVAVTEEDEEVKAASRAEAERIRKRRGAASNIYTGPEGVMGTATTTKTKLGE